MNSEQLYNLLACICSQKKISFDVIASDEFESLNYNSLPMLIIFNASPRNSKNNGTHWMAACVTKKRFQINFEIFDPLGKKIEDYNIRFKYAISKENLTKIQGNDSIRCGEFALFWCYNQINCLSTSFFLSFFSDNFLKNDEIVSKFERKINRCCFSYVPSFKRKQSCLSPNSFVDIFNPSVRG